MIYCTHVFNCHNVTLNYLLFFLKKNVVFWISCFVKLIKSGGRLVIFASMRFPKGDSNF